MFLKTVESHNEIFQVYKGTTGIEITTDQHYGGDTLSLVVLKMCWKNLSSTVIIKSYFRTMYKCINGLAQVDMTLIFLNFKGELQSEQKLMNSLLSDPRIPKIIVSIPITLDFLHKRHFHLQNYRLEFRPGCQFKKTGLCREFITVLMDLKRKKIVFVHFWVLTTNFKKKNFR